MTLEQMCCTQEQSKRLRDLGVEQKSYFYWTTLPHIIHLEYLPKNLSEDSDIIGSAWTVGELGILLPDVYDDYQWVTISNAGTNKAGINLEPPNCFSLHMGETTESLDTDSFDKELYPSEAQARAAYLISLLENNLLSPEQVNKRLHE